MAALPVLLISGCGGSGSSSVTGGGLSGALHAVSASPAAREYFEWGDLRTQRQLAGMPGSALEPSGHLNSRWEQILGIGASQLVPFASTLASKLSIDPYEASAGITIGEPPAFAVRLDGPRIDGAAVAAALRRVGAKQQDGGLLALPSGSTSPLYTNSAYALPPGLVNRASANGHTVAIGQTQAAVSAILGAGATLGDEPAYQAAANCLGDVVWAVIAPPRTLGVQPGPQMIAIGGRRPASASSPAVEVLCAIDHGSRLVENHAAAMRRMLRPTMILPATNEPIDAVIAASSVARDDSSGLQVVRAQLTLRGGQPAGFLFEALENRELALFFATTCTGRQILGPSATPEQIAALCHRLGLETGP